MGMNRELQNSHQFNESIPGVFAILRRLYINHTVETQRVHRILSCHELAESLVYVNIRGPECGPLGYVTSVKSKHFWLYGSIICDKIPRTRISLSRNLTIPPEDAYGKCATGLLIRQWTSIGGYDVNILIGGLRENKLVVQYHV